MRVKGLIVVTMIFAALSSAVLLWHFLKVVTLLLDDLEKYGNWLTRWTIKNMFLWIVGAIVGLVGTICYSLVFQTAIALGLI